PVPFLVPHGLIFAALGLVYLCVSLGAVSDAPLVVLTRRELAAYFCSPIAYVILAVTTVIGGLGYHLFRSFLLGNERQNFGVPEPALEPILKDFVPGSII